MASRYEEQKMGGLIEPKNPFGPGRMAPGGSGGWPREAQEDAKVLKKWLDEQNKLNAKPVQQFTSGATRSSDAGKNEYEGFLSPIAIEEFGDYMTRHRVQPDGSVREPDNWQKGIPISSYMRSLFRHVLELWALYRGRVPKRVAKELPGRSLYQMKLETACAIFFNIQGFIHETVKEHESLQKNAPTPTHFLSGASA